MRQTKIYRIFIASRNANKDAGKSICLDNSVTNRQVVTVTTHQSHCGRWGCERNSKSLQSNPIWEIDLMTKKGWSTLPLKYRETGKDGSELIVPKRVLVQRVLWGQVVENLLGSGFSDDQIRECFKEYGCGKSEIDGYFAAVAA